MALLPARSGYAVAPRHPGGLLVLLPALGGVPEQVPAEAVLAYTPRARGCAVDGPALPDRRIVLPARSGCPNRVASSVVAILFPARWGAPLKAGC